MSDLVLTVEEAARLTRISRGLAYQMVREGRLPSIRLGRRILVPRSALENVLASGGAGSNGGESTESPSDPP